MADLDLRPISDGPSFLIECERCRRRMWSEGNYARMDGVPFVSYYCAKCAAALRYTKPDGTVSYYGKRNQ